MESWLNATEELLLDLRRGGMTVETTCVGALLHSVIQFDGDIQNFVCIEKDGVLPSAADLAEHRQKMAARVANFSLLRKAVIIGRYGALGAADLGGFHWALLPHALSHGLSLGLVAVPLMARFTAPKLTRFVIGAMAGRIKRDMKEANKKQEKAIKEKRKNALF